MSLLNRTKLQLRFKQGLVANINTTATKNLAVTGEPHYATDTRRLYVFDGTSNLDVGGFNLLSSTSVDMQTAQANTLYTVPAGVTAFISHIVVRSPSATLAGGTDYDFTNFRQTVDLSTMTAITDYMVIRGADVTKYTENTAAGTISITVNTGSTGVATATIDLFGYLK